MSKEKEIEIRVEIPTNVYFLAGVRNFAFEIFQNVMELEEKWNYRFQAVVDELANNAIRYGSDRKSKVEVTFRLKKDKFAEIEVADSGSGEAENSLKELAEIFEIAKSKIGRPSFDLGGRGFQIVGSWCDDIDFYKSKKGGVSVIVRKDFSKLKEISEFSHEKKPNVLVLEV